MRLWFLEYALKFRLQLGIQIFIAVILFSLMPGLADFRYIPDVYLLGNI